jgi:sulfite reductase (ferredoxin)
MVRIKLPYGKMTLRQLKRIADISDEYSTGNLHFTTRQDIQIHFVSLDRTPELWAKLEQEDITLREACGNTVRNVTASPETGIDPTETFDITPYADALFRYFLRNPICQDMGRKIKIAFSNSEADTALTYMHDLGFVPKLNGTQRGFKIVVGGGLGAQPMLAQVAHEFLAEDQLIPYTEAVLRVFDRYGERNNRSKARLKFLIQKIGFDTFQELVTAEHIALKSKNFPIEVPAEDVIENPDFVAPSGEGQYGNWLETNTFAQKQKGFYGVWVRVPLGNMSSTVARDLISRLEGYIADDIRVSISQGLLLRSVKAQDLPYVYEVLASHKLAEVGANSVVDITACPGTDTCNLAISNSTDITLVLEEVVEQEFPALINQKNLRIKISGCMNSCGQHGMANIGFHGSSLKSGGRVLPALQVLLGGGTVGDGIGRVADKVLKVPSKRATDVLRYVLADFQNNATENELFNEYYDRQGEKYFYHLLKPLTDLASLTEDEFLDWGHTETFETAIGVGECAGVKIDLVATLLYEAAEKIAWAKESFLEHRYADAIYHGYSLYIQGAKALLLDKDVNCSTQHGVMAKFEEHLSEAGLLPEGIGFKEAVLRINQNEPSQDFAKEYIHDAEAFLEKATAYRENSLLVEN